MLLNKISKALNSRWQILIICSLFVLSACAEENDSDKPVRMVITADAITWDNQSLRFDQPFSDWIKVLGNDYIRGDVWRSEVRFLGPSRFVYPKLGIDIEVARNHKDPISDKINGKKWTLKDPFNRYVSVVRINLNPAYIVHNIGMNDETEKHPYNTMFADYAIDFYGAIVDSNTPKSTILKFSDGHKMSNHFNSITSTLEYHNYPVRGSILFNDFYEQKPEMSILIELGPSSELKRNNDIKYFGYAME